MNKVHIRDLLLLIRKDKRYRTGAVILFLLFVSPFIVGSKDQKIFKKRASHHQPVTAGRTPEGEVAQDLIEVFKVSIDQLNGDVAVIRRDVDDQNTYILENEKRITEILKRILARDDSENSNVNQAGVAPVYLENREGEAYEMESTKLDQFGFEDPIPVYPENEKFGKIATIGSGDRVRVRLLSGVIADTNGTPYPVVFQIESEIMGPNQTRLPVGDAVIIAAAQGSLRDSRVIFRLNKLNLSLPNGRKKVIPVDGWVIGEDGMQGMRGELIDPFGKALAGAMAAGIVDGLGEGFSASQVTNSNSPYFNTSTVTGDYFTYVVGRSLKGGAGEMSRYLKERADLLEPGVQVLSDRVSTAVFTESVTIPDLYQQLEKLQSEDYMHMD